MNNYYRDVLVLFAFIAGLGIAVIAVVWFKVRERRWWITLWLRCLHTIMYRPLMSWIAKRLCLFWLFDDKNLDGSCFPRWDKIPLSEVSFVEIAKFSSVCDETRIGIIPPFTTSMIHIGRVRFNRVHARELTPKSNDVAKLRAWEVDAQAPNVTPTCVGATLPHLTFSLASHICSFNLKATYTKLSWSIPLSNTPCQTMFCQCMFCGPDAVWATWTSTRYALTCRYQSYKIDMR